MEDNKVDWLFIEYGRCHNMDDIAGLNREWKNIGEIKELESLPSN